MEAGLAELKFELERLRDDVDGLLISSRNMIGEEFGRARELICVFLTAAQNAEDEALENLFTQVFILFLETRALR